MTDPVGRVLDDLAIVLVLLLLVGDVLVGEEEVLGAEQPDPGRPDLLRRLGVGQVVDVGQQLDLRAVGAEGGLVAVHDEPVLEVEELALHLAIGGGRLVVGADEDHAVAAVDDHQVAVLDVVHDPHDARDGRDARGSAARIAAWLVDAAQPR